MRSDNDKMDPTSCGEIPDMSGPMCNRESVVSRLQQAAKMMRLKAHRIEQFADELSYRLRLGHEAETMLWEIISSSRELL